MNKPRLLPILAAAGLLLCATNVLSAETAEALYQEHCLGCHGTEVYTRQDSKISSMDALEGQVQRCELGLGLRWFDEDIAQVAEYLDQNFYHFKH